MTTLNGYNYAYTLTADGAVTVATTGTVGPGSDNYGGVALSALSGGSVLNNGLIFGGVGYYGSRLTGGAGLSIADATTAQNRGVIEGGKGGYGYDYGTTGGAGATISGATLTNIGGATITGGMGGGASGADFARAGYGGDGVDVGNGVLTNAGLITGGGPGTGSFYPVYGGFGVNLTGASRLTNDRSGVISGDDGVVFERNGSGVIQNSGSITSTIYGVSLLSPTETLINSGYIYGGDDRGILRPSQTVGQYYYYAAGHGAALIEGGRLTNQLGAEISGFQGVSTAGTVTATVTNFGVIIGGNEGGYSKVGSNQTYLISAGVGVRMTAGGKLVNEAGAYIAGYDGVIVSGSLATTVTNYGTIESTETGDGAVVFGSPADVLNEEGSGVLIGGAQGGGGKLMLAAGAGAGTISSLGGQITGFATIEVEAGAGWTFGGDNTITTGELLKTLSALVVDGTLTNRGTIQESALIHLGTGGTIDNVGTGRLLIEEDVSITPSTGATGTTMINAGLLEKQAGTGLSQITMALVNSGTVIANTGTLKLAGAVTGTGLMHINSGATLEFGSTVGPGTKVLFSAGSGEVLEVNNGGATFSAQVQGFGVGKTLDLASIPFGAGTKLDYSSTAKTLTVSNGARTITIALLGQFQAAGFSDASNGHGGTDVTYSPPPAAALANPLAAGH